VNQPRRARTLMIERAVHLPPRADGSLRSLSACAVAFALSPANSDRISLSCCARASAFRRTASMPCCRISAVNGFGPCGLPSLTPRALAAASAALVRSLILVRSCSATAA